MEPASPTVTYQPVLMILATVWPSTIPVRTIHVRMAVNARRSTITATVVNVPATFIVVRIAVERLQTTQILEQMMSIVAPVTKAVRPITAISLSAATGQPASVLKISVRCRPVSDLLCSKGFACCQDNFVAFEVEWHMLLVSLPSHFGESIIGEEFLWKS